jgi:tRNA-dihydrouridine synthase A
MFGMDNTEQSRDDIVAALLPYVERQLARGAQLNHITRHILGLYQGVPGARKFRRHLSENAYKKDAGLQVLIDALALVSNGGKLSAAGNSGRLSSVPSKIDQTT